MTASFEVTDTDQVGRLYIDGDLKAEKHGMTVSPNFGTQVVIGSLHGKYYYTGLLDEVRAFK